MPVSFALLMPADVVRSQSGDEKKTAFADHDWHH